VSPRRLDGWEPVETHRHYDPDGVLTGVTVVTRDPEWDEQAAADAESLTELDAMTLHCGHAQSDALNDQLVHDVESFECGKCRALRLGRDQYDKTHKNRDGESDVGDRVFYIAGSMTVDQYRAQHPQRPDIEPRKGR
jgi:hypothetical protein